MRLRIELGLGLGIIELGIVLGIKVRDTARDCYKVRVKD